VILWISESKAREWHPQAEEQRKKPRRGDLGELFETTRKEQHHKDKEGYREMV